MVKRNVAAFIKQNGLKKQSIQILIADHIFSDTIPNKKNKPLPGLKNSCLKILFSVPAYY